MKPARTAAVLIGAAIAGVSLLASAQQKFDLGKREYESNCASCHGLKGKGDGPYAEIMKMYKIPLPDLTTLSKRNGGVFPFARVYETIDGRQMVRAHGSMDMPVWGRDYVVEAQKAYLDEGSLMFPYDPELFIRARILALTDYIYRMQAK
jgi:mono/diheme cytochrome c family protein